LKFLALIACGALAVAACSSSGGRSLGPDGGAGVGGTPDAAAAGTGGQPDAAGPPTKTYQFQTTVNRDVDMLVMIDNSSSMKALQTKLVASFATLTDVLQGLPGGLPNLHLAVVSSDLGAGKYDIGDIPACRYGGDQGKFQNMPRGTTCANGSLMPGQNFIIANNAGGNNYTGTLADAFGCIAALGDSGCGFEHQFGSVLRALGADGNGGPPAQNANFLRPNAHLFILLLTNEDDCSAPINSAFFDPTSVLVSDPLGPLNSYRCNRFGHLCNGMRPPATPPEMGQQDLGMCTSAEDGMLLKVAEVAARLKTLKADASLVHVAAIAGPTKPYAIEGDVPLRKEETAPLWPYVAHSCKIDADNTFADPAVRISELVDKFGSNGFFQVICNDSFQPALQAFGEQIGGAISPDSCIDAGTAPTQCTAVEHVTNAQGLRVDTPLPACFDNGNKAPCWDARSSALCGQGLAFSLKLAAPPAVGEKTTVTCPVTP
jgi:hypothetical protein